MIGHSKFNICWESADAENRSPPPWENRRRRCGIPTALRPYQPKQKLLPSHLREWLPEGHLGYRVSDLVDGLELTATKWS